MSTVLLILKILGILLLILLGILLYLICFPVWLRARGGYDGEPFLHGRILGFLSFWQVDIDIRGKARDLAVAAFWGKLKLYPRPQKKPKAAKAEDAAGSKKDHASDSKPKAESAAKTEADKTPPPAKPEEVKAESSAVKPEEVKAESPAVKPEESAVESVTNPEKSQEEPTAEETEEPKTESAGGPDLSAIFDLVKDPSTYRAVGTALKWIFYIPKKMRFHLGGTNIRFALSDPQVTGMLSAALLQLPAYYEPDVIFEPDFTSEDPYMDGVVCLNAHLSIAMILYAAIRILLDRDCRRLIKAGLALAKD